MSLFNSSWFGVIFGLGTAQAPALICDREEEGTASVGVVARCERDEES